MTTLKPSPQTSLLPMELPLTSFAAASHAKTLAWLEKARGLRESAAAFGANMPESLASYDHDLCLWKTSQRSLAGGLETFLETWPRSGTMRGGIVYQQAPLVCLMDATACGLLPTLGKNEPKGASSKRYVGSPHYRGAKMSEGLRHGPLDPIYLHPGFAEQVMGFPTGWTALRP